MSAQTAEAQCYIRQACIVNPRQIPGHVPPLMPCPQDACAVMWLWNSVVYPSRCSYEELVAWHQQKMQLEWEEQEQKAKYHGMTDPSDT